ncbi:MAG: S8 family serine peptidase, partial [Proteobacteria bacterium]|nr:S8 family serine peptidase [Pseudomonadota bacterium]
EIIRAKSEAGVRVFNLSLGVSGLNRDYDYSIFAKVLDDIAAQHSVLFVVSAGNLRGTNERPPWPIDGDKALRQLALHPTVDERITAPAEHLLGLSVGALNTPGISGHGANLPASYTRRGPGVGGVLKPDLTHYGGVSSRAGGGSGLFSYESDNSVVDKSGTSFAPPLVASTLATIDHRLEGTVPRETLIALLVHRAQRCDVLEQVPLRHVAREFVGFGMSPPADECLSDNPHSITLVFSESLVSRKELQFIFTWPKSLVTLTGKCRGQVDLTLAFTPPIDARFDAECIRTQLEAYLHQIENDPDTGEEKPISRLKHLDGVRSGHPDFATERELLKSGLKWAPVKRYRLTMPKGCGTSSNWRLVLRSSSRAGFFFSNIRVPFALVMTISDVERTAPVYDEVRNEINRRGLKLVDITVAHRVRPRN